MWFEQFKAERQSELVGYGNLLSTVASGGAYIARQLAWIIDLRRLAIVFIIVVGLGLLVYLTVKEIAFRRAQKESRCRNLKNQFGRSNQATAIVSKNGAQLMSISYDMYAKLSKTACACATGNVLNAFWYKQFDFRSKTVANNSLNCMCDTDYALMPGGYVYTGDPKLVQFMQTGDRTDAKAVFGVVVRGGSGVSASYLKKLEYTCPVDNTPTITIPNANASPPELTFTLPPEAVTLDSLSYVVTYTANASAVGLSSLTACIMDADHAPVPNTMSSATMIGKDVVIRAGTGPNIKGSFMFSSAIVALTVGTTYSMSFTWAGGATASETKIPLKLDIDLTLNYQKIETDTSHA